MNWYLRRGNKPVGPVSFEDIKKGLLGGQIEPDELLWQEEANEWKAALAWSEFRTLSVPVYQEIHSVSETEEVWTILRESLKGPEMTGPWSLTAIRNALREGHLKPSDYLWKKGMTGWARLSLRPENLISGDPEIPSQL